MNQSVIYKPAHGGYSSDFAVSKDRVEDFRAIAEAAYGTESPLARNMSEAQQAAIVGGLQPHSVGDIYPLCVVAIANGDRIVYEVHDLQRDLVAIQRDYEEDDMSPIPEEPRFWHGASAAWNWANLLVEGKRWTLWRPRVGIKRTRGV